MPAIDLDQETYDQLLLASRLTDEEIGDLVRRLVRKLIAEPRSGSVSGSDSGDGIGNGASLATPADGWIPVHKVYKGNRVAGAFHPGTHEVRLSTEPWANQHFASPTAAAITVVDHFSGNVRETPNTNGRLFWKVDATGQPLRSIIGER